MKSVTLLAGFAGGRAQRPPSLDWFIYAFVRKEAVVSSQIEGTQASLVDLLTFQARSDEGPKSADVEEVCNYLDALSFARAFDFAGTSVAGASVGCRPFATG